MDSFRQKDGGGQSKFQYKKVAQLENEELVNPHEDLLNEIMEAPIDYRPKLSGK